MRIFENLPPLYLQNLQNSFRTVLTELNYLAYSCGIPAISWGTTAKNSGGRGNPIKSRRTSSLPRTARPAAFFASEFCCVFSMGACAGRAFARPVPRCRYFHPRTGLHLSRGKEGGGSSKHLGTLTMHTLSLRLHALNPSVKRRAAAHRAMALAALRSNSSLKNRLQRYNAHIAKARQLEGKGGAA